MEGVSVKKSCIDKTIWREIAKNSLQAVAAYICVVAATHILPTAVEDSSMMKELKDHASKGAVKLFNFATSALGRDVPAMIVQPRYILTTNNVPMYWIPGVSPRRETQHIIQDASLPNVGVCSNYNYSETSRCNGIRVKLTHTFSISEHTAAIFISISGFNEWEIPKSTCPDGVLLLKVPGLAVGGGGCSVDDDRLGYVLLMWRGMKVDEFWYCKYQDLVLGPFITNIWRRFDNWDGNHATLTLAMQVISHQDGNIAQMQILSMILSGTFRTMWSVINITWTKRV